MRDCVENECVKAFASAHLRTHALRIYGDQPERALMHVRLLNLSTLLLVFLLSLAGCSGNQDISSLVLKASEGDSRASMKLVEAMGSMDKEVALEAYKGVIDIGPGIGPFLIKGLESSEDTVVEASAAALGNLGDKGSIPALIRILEGDGGRRYAAAWALGEIGDLSVVPNLVTSLGSPDTLLQKSAVRALVKLGPEAGQMVTAFLVETADISSQRAAIRVVGELKTSIAVDILVSIGGPNRDAAAWALGRIGGHGALDPLLDALSDPRWQVRREAAQALGNLEDDKAVDALTRALDDTVTVVREWAARSLETITGRQVLYLGEDGDMIPPYNLYR